MKQISDCEAVIAMWGGWRGGHPLHGNFPLKDIFFFIYAFPKSVCHGNLLTPPTHINFI